MEVHHVRRGAVRLALGLRDGAVDRAGVLPHALGHRQRADERQDVAQVRPVMVVAVFMLVSMLMVMVMVVLVLMNMLVAVVVLMRMFMHVVVRMFMGLLMAMPVPFMAMQVLVLLQAVDGHGGVGAGDAVALRARELHLHAGQAQLRHFAQKALAVGRQLIERGHQHIARRAHAAVKIKCSHCSVLTGDLSYWPDSPPRSRCRC